MGKKMWKNVRNLSL
ncbi:hypothetical protein A2U01_0116198, partial [Trifolium medium]|nr:hypothetical protein [Trifolium medium]